MAAAAGLHLPVFPQSRQVGHTTADRSPGYRLCYVTEQYVPMIGYLKERVRT
jgi:hypothetical protein